MVRPRTRWPLVVLALTTVWATAGRTLAGETEQIAALRAIEARLPTIDWPAARLELKTFDDANPARGPEARDERQRVGALVAAMRDPYFREFVERRFEPIVRERIRRRVVAPESRHAREVRWVKNWAKDESLGDLRREIRAVDPAATDAEVARFWKERPGRMGVMNEVAWPRERPFRAVGAWRSASVDRRVRYLFGRFVLACGLFELPPPPDDRACDRCNEEGILTYEISNGGWVTVLCPKCKGHPYPRALRYR